MTNKKKSKIYAKGEDDSLFEVELFQALKSYGYIFPENTKEVERFEELYGSTEIEVPSNLESKIKDTPLSIGFGADLGMAAFSSSANDSTDMTERLLNNDPESESDEAPKK